MGSGKDSEFSGFFAKRGSKGRAGFLINPGVEPSVRARLVCAPERMVRRPRAQLCPRDFKQTTPLFSDSIREIGLEEDLGNFPLAVHPCP